MEAKRSKGKVVIVGAGFVGASTAFAIASSGIASELILVDVNVEKAYGEAMDLNHGLAFLSPSVIEAGDYSDVKDADVIIIAAGSARKPGETRLDLAKKNAGIIKSIIPNIMQYYNGGVFLVISNPVDVLTYLIQKITGLPPFKVIGSGTVLDSARFRYLLSSHCKVDIRNVHGYVLGEHGDSEVLVWSRVNLAGEKVDEYCNACEKQCGGIERDKIEKGVKEAGAEIIKRKGATYYGIALSVTRICEAILKNQRSILTVGSVIDGPYGIQDSSISLPCIVGINGIEKIFEIKLEEYEEIAIRASAAKVRESIDSVLEDNLIDVVL